VGGKSQTSTQQVSIPPSVLARYNSVNSQAQTAAAAPFQDYSGQFVSPINSTEQAGITQAQGAANEAQPYYGQATSALGAANGASQPYYGAATGLISQSGEAVDPSNLGKAQIDKYLSPYLSQVLGSTSSVLNQNNQQQQAGQLGNAISSGAFGGDRTGIAAANLEQQQNLANANIYSGIENQGFNTALGAAQQQQGVQLGAAQANRAALGQAGEGLAGLGQTIYGQGANYANELGALGTGAQSAAESGAASELGAGQLAQQTGQAQDTAEYNQFLQQQSYPFQVAQFLANIAEGTGALSGSTTTTTTPGGLFSDRRLKEDVRKIGKTFDGQTIYSFRYKDDPQNLTRMGLMAQDVEKHTPDAVGLAGGFKTVDYDKATEKAADRGHFADGGSPDIGAILQAQAASYAPINGAGAAGVAGGMPRGASSYVPASSANTNHLAVAGPMPAVPSAVQNMTDWANLAKAGTGAAESVGGAWNKFTGHSTAPPAATSTPDASPAAPVSSGIVPANDTSTLTGGDMGMPPYRRGGRMRRAAGGLAHAYADGGMPYGDDDGPMSISIPDDQNTHQLMTAGNMPGTGPSTLSQIGQVANTAGDLAKAATTILPMIGLKTGGVAGRAGFDAGGSPAWNDSDYDAAGSWAPTLDAVGNALGSAWNGATSALSSAWNNPNGYTPKPGPGSTPASMTPSNGLGVVPQNIHDPVNAPPRPVTAGDVARAVGPSTPVHVAAPPAAGLAPTVSPATSATDPLAGLSGLHGDDDISTDAPAPIDPDAGLGGLGSASSDSDTPLSQSYSAPARGGLGGLGDTIGSGAKSVGKALAPEGGFFDNLMHGKASSIVPLLTGLAAMEAAPTRNGFVALTQGLGAGAQTYMNNQEQAAKIAQEQAQVGQTQAGTYNLSKPPAPPGKVSVQGKNPDPNGQTFIDAQGRPWHYEMEFALTNYAPKPTMGAVPSAGTPADGSPTTSAPTATPTSPVQTDPASGSYTVAPSSLTDAYMASHYHVSPATTPGDTARNHDMLYSTNPELAQQNDAEEKASQARIGDLGQVEATQSQLVQLGAAINGLSDGGFSGAGAGFDDRTRLLNIYNTYAGILGAKPDPNVQNAVTNSQIIDKIKTLTGAALAHQDDQRAASIAHALSSVLPGGSQTKAASNDVLSNMMVQNQKLRDFAQYKDNYAQRYGTLVNVEQAFQRDMGSQYDKEQKLLPIMMHRSSPTSPSSAELVRTATPAQIRKFEQVNGPGSSRYFR